MFIHSIFPRSPGLVKYNSNSRSQWTLLSEEAKSIMGTFLAGDLELYEFVVQRLHLQAKALGIVGEA